MLSNIGEKMAYQMKSDLFSAIIKQDVAFFDQHRTGEVINRYFANNIVNKLNYYLPLFILRLTTDIQDFKSSFKQTVSGGLRAVTQIIGCAASLVIISPHMTFVTLLCIPTVVAVGTLFGSMLRITSRKAQAQVRSFLPIFVGKLMLLLLCLGGKNNSCC